MALRHARPAPPALPPLREGGTRGEARGGGIRAGGLPFRQPDRHPRVVRQREDPAAAGAAAVAVEALQALPAALEEGGEQSSALGHVSTGDRAQARLIEGETSAAREQEEDGAGPLLED